MLRSENSRTMLRAWQAARGSELVPLASAFGAPQLREILPFITIFRIGPEARAKIVLCGTAVCEAAGIDPTGWDSVRFYPEAEHETIRAMERFVIAHDYIIHSLRLLQPSASRTATVEQLFLPVADETGKTDRFYMVLDNVKVLSDMAPSQGGPNMPMGRLIERTLYDPRTLEPVACDFSLPALESRNEAEGLAAYL